MCAAAPAICSATPIGRKGVLAIPFVGALQFPGFPINEEDVERL